MPKEITEIKQDFANENGKDYYNRNTLEVAKSFIDKEKIHTRSKKYLQEEQRLAFISVWTAFNLCFSKIVDIYDKSPEEDKEDLDNIVKGIPVGFNLPLETRVPLAVRNSSLTQADQSAKKAGKAGPIVIQGYNDEQSLEDWDKLKKEREQE